MKTITLTNRDEDHYSMRRGEKLQINVERITLWYEDRRDHNGGSIVCYGNVDAYLEVTETPEQITQLINTSDK